MNTGNFMISGSVAQKAAGTTWVAASDRRLKNNITVANLDECADVVKSIDLKRFTWDSKVSSHDSNVLGWIAQEVEPYFPKAIQTQSMYGIDDCKLLDADQLNMNSYGALKWALNRIDDLEKRLAVLEQR
jgi:hypothetical protein